MTKTCLHDRTILYSDVIREVVNSDGLQMWQKEGLMENLYFQTKHIHIKHITHFRPILDHFIKHINTWKRKTLGVNPLLTQSTTKPFFAWFSTLTHDCLVKNNKCTMKIRTMEDVITCVDACTHLNVFY